MATDSVKMENDHKIWQRRREDRPGRRRGDAHLDNVKVVIKDEGEDGARYQEILNPKEVLVLVVRLDVSEPASRHQMRRRRGLHVNVPDQVDSVGGRRDEKDLCEGVVDRDKAPEEVKVARHIHDEKEKLRLERDACRGPALARHSHAP